MRVALMTIALLAACSPEPVPPAIAELATDALRAASEIKVRGDVDAVLREHPHAPRYAAAMAKHFRLMRKLHGVGLQSSIRYPRSYLQVRHDQFCERGDTAHLVVTAGVRYDMEPIPPARGTPHYTASEEQHVFRFHRDGQGQWMMAAHHEITLAELHDRETVARLRNPCAPP
jgi:hypothetical protein